MVILVRTSLWMGIRQAVGRRRYMDRVLAEGMLPAWWSRSWRRHIAFFFSALLSPRRGAYVARLQV